MRKHFQMYFAIHFTYLTVKKIFQINSNDVGFTNKILISLADPP